MFYFKIIDITHIYDFIKSEMLIQRYKRIVNLLNMQLKAANNFNLFNMILFNKYI